MSETIEYKIRSDSIDILKKQKNDIFLFFVSTKTIEPVGRKRNFADWELFKHVELFTWT